MNKELEEALERLHRAEAEVFRLRVETGRVRASLDRLEADLTVATAEAESAKRGLVSRYREQKAEAEIAAKEKTR